MHRRGSLPEHGKIPFAAVLSSPTDKVLIVLVDCVVCEMHVSSLQVACLQPWHCETSMFVVVAFCLTQGHRQCYSGMLDEWKLPCKTNQSIKYVYSPWGQ